VDPFVLGEGLQIRRFRGADGLDAFAGEIFGKAGKGQPGTIYRWLADGAPQALGAGEQLELERAGVRGKKAFNGNEVTLHGPNLKRALPNVKPETSAPGNQLNPTMHVLIPWILDIS
jgi:hypothetical protein